MRPVCRIEHDTAYAGRIDRDAAAAVRPRPTRPSRAAGAARARRSARGRRFSSSIVSMASSCCRRCAALVAHPVDVAVLQQLRPQESRRCAIAAFRERRRRQRRHPRRRAGLFAGALEPLGGLLVSRGATSNTRSRCPPCTPSAPASLAMPRSSRAMARSGRPGPLGYASVRKIAPNRYATLNCGSSEVTRSSSGYSRSKLAAVTVRAALLLPLARRLPP